MAQPAAHSRHSVGRRSEALTARPLGKTFSLHCQRRHPKLPTIPTYLPLTARHRYVRSSIDISIDSLFSIEKIRSNDLFPSDNLFRSTL